MFGDKKFRYLDGELLFEQISKFSFKFITMLKNKTNFLTMGLFEKLGLLPETKILEEMGVKLRAEVLKLYKEAE